MKQRIKRILSALLVLVMIVATPIGDFVGLNVTANATVSGTDEAGYQTWLAQMKNTFRHGEYWNAYNSVGYEGTGTTPCYCSGTCPEDCKCSCGSFIYNNEWIAGQCHGFALKLGNLLFGGNPNTWGKVYNANSLCAGDFVRLNSGHTIFITKVSGNDVTYADCNASGPCMVTWDKTTTKSALNSSLQYVGHYSGNALTGSVSSSTPTAVVPDPVFYSVENGNYTLRNVSVGYMMNVYGGTDADGTRVVSWAEDGSVEQRFRLAHQNNGEYLIYAMCSSNGNGRVVNINQGNDGKISIGDSLNLYTQGAWANQLFRFVPIGSDAYVIEVVGMDDVVVGLTANSNDADITIQKYTGALTQRWFLCDNDGNVVDAAGNFNINSFSTVTITDCTYSGEEVFPIINVTLGDLTLMQGKDYTVEYSNNINAGTATATITGIGYYTGTITKTFKINPKSISGLTLSAIANQTYTGAAIKPAITLKNGTYTLTNGTHYTVTYSNNTNVGTATVTITGKGNYTGTKTTTFKIVAKAASGLTISAIADQTYTGSAITPAVTVKNGYTTLTKDTHYTVAYSNNTNVGTATVTITGKGNYTGTKTTTFKIIAKAASNFTVSSIGTQYYTGSAITPAVTVKDGSTTLTNGTHYTVAYSNNVNAGTATVTITGKGNYTGTKTVTFTIAQKPISAMTFSEIAAQTYTGAAITPTVTVKHGTTTLINGTHYTLSYSNNKNVGQATLVVTGKGNYSGIKTLYFDITAKSISGLSLSDIADQIYTGSEITPEITLMNATYPLTLGTHYTVAYSNNTNVGTATVTITGKGNYTGTKTATFKIVAKAASGLTISSIADQTYTGSAITPAVTVKDGSKTLTNGTDYTVAYSNNTNVGTATVTITGKGNYTGTNTATFNIVAAVVPPASVKATAGEGKITLTWDAVTGATKYRVRRNDGTGWVNYKDLTSTSFTDTAVTNGTKYSYAVYAYVGNAWSGASAIVSATPTGSVIAQNVKATADTGKITLTWSAVSGATKYRVRRNDGTGWVNYKDLTSTSFTDTAVTNGTKYSYAIYSYVGNAWGGASAIVSATPTGSVIAQNVKATAGTGKVTLTWSAVSGATKYRVRRNDGSGWVNYKDLTSTSFTDTAVTNGTKYSYAIYSYVGNAWGGASAIVSATPTGSVIAQNVKATAGEGKVTLTWGAVSGATKYRIRRNDGTGWVNYKDLTTLAFVDTSVTEGKTYYYAVYSYVNGAWGGASAIVSTTPTASTVAKNVNILNHNGGLIVSWDTVTNATMYRIRRNDGTGWVNYIDLTNTAYVDWDVTSGKTYYYAIYTYVNGAWSDASTIVSATA